MGQNIGTCVTALLSSIGANKTARKAALIHLYFNVIGTIIFLTAIYLFQTFIGFPFWQKYINAQDIANFHTVFNITNTIILLPFSNLLVKLANMTIKTTPAEAEITTKLDERLLSVPAMAIEQVKGLVISMFLLAKENNNPWKKRCF
jgi:phosphate:Na+ symporter